jgi:ditrans,polycis-polyprenyl diphosphate synthase
LEAAWISSSHTPQGPPHTVSIVTTYSIQYSLDCDPSSTLTDPGSPISTLNTSPNKYTTMSADYGTHLRRWAMSLPPVESAVTYLRDLLIRSLQCGPIPEHIAFVMDGNRRYARSRKLETVEGHNLGFEALAKILEVCYKSGVKCVTIYAFSIENFKRSRWEVDALMDMAKTKLVQMSAHGELFERYGAKVRVLGDRDLIREDVLKQVDRAVEMTKDNGKAVLNVCFPYTSREEITHSIRETVKDFSNPPEKKKTKKLFSENHIQQTIRSRQLYSVEEEESRSQDSLLPPSRDDTTIGSDVDSAFSDQDRSTTSTNQHDEAPSSRTSHDTSPVLKPSQKAAAHLPDPETITAETLTKNMYTCDSPPLDLLIRTSGVSRLSDFMLWQCHEGTELRFLDILWPEFDLLHFLPVLLEWQWNQKKAKQEEARLGRRGGDKSKAH